MDNYQGVNTIELLDVGYHQAALHKLFIRKDYRRKNIGVAQQLVDSILNWAKAQSIQTIYIGTTEAYKTAQRF